jgi:uncharacterized protein YjbJ (UPF0337 family)
VGVIAYLRVNGGATGRSFESRLGAPDLSVRRRPFTGTRYQEQVMSMNKDQVKGRVKEVEGMIKEVAGKLVGNEKLEEKGKVQKILGEAQAAVGDIKQDVKDAVKGA